MDIDKSLFENTLKEFKEQVDKCVQRGDGKTTGATPKEIEKSLDTSLKNNNYESCVSFGSGKLADTCGIAFVRKDILGEQYVNSEKFQQSKGIYIYIGYKHKNGEWYICLGNSENCKECEAKIFKENKKYFNKGNKNFDVKKLYGDFVKLMKEFNKIPKEHFVIQNIKDKGENMSNTQAQNTIPLNQILYGPPGTGKTYSTINKALEILAGDKYKDSLEPTKRDEILQILKELKENPSDKESRQKARGIFNVFKDKGQIAFITFHQSFSYEEFIEGIKPNTDNPQNMTYEVQNGIFKEICEEALKNYQEHQISNNKTRDLQINAKEIFQSYALELKQKLDNGESINFLNKMKIQSVNINQNGEIKSISIGVDESPFQSLTQEIISRDYLNFKNNKIKTYKDIKPRYESQSQWHGNAIYYFELYKKLQEFEETEYKQDFKPMQKVSLKPYILIIDEINRGNISKILGELITLLEPSKRIGSKEELSVTLPYGKENFGVPKNLYIIGTMNTADRSIALLDTALRRRFEFIEMMPDFTLLNKDCEGMDLQELLQKMNARIEFLLDREHTIGHSFFMEIQSINELKGVFTKKIIPLLQEYFYEDYAKIDAVLNGNGMIEIQKNSNFSELFDNKFSNLDTEKVIYKITNSSDWNIKHFQKIYDNTIKLDDKKDNEA